MTERKIKSINGTNGIRDGQFLFGFSANPGASFVGLERFVRQVLLGMQGKGRPYLREHKDRLVGGYAKSTSFQRFVQGTCYEEGQWFAKPVGIDPISRARHFDQRC